MSAPFLAARPCRPARQVLRRASDLVKPGAGRLATDPSVAASKQGRFRLRLISAVVMEAYVWLPPGSYPNQVRSERSGGD